MTSSITCPHCGKLIELVEPRELKEEYGLGQNSKARMGKDDAFPMPVLKFPNRNIWLKSEVDAYIEEKSRRHIARLVADFEQTIAGLPPEERDKAREMLAADSRRKRR